MKKTYLILFIISTFLISSCSFRYPYPSSCTLVENINTQDLSGIYKNLAEGENGSTTLTLSGFLFDNFEERNYYSATHIEIKQDNDIIEVIALENDKVLGRKELSLKKARIE
ncbi:MAG: hypothetical protein HY810_07680 [Candidatus Omnitrophica bacterium]|nr:hypothetical protein [Candidatus Omnitrophota bacterium]